jgi:hypothetical protein
MSDFEITSADVAAVMTIEDLYPSGFTLEQFGADQGIMGEPVQEVESHMTLDGKLVAGFTPTPQPITITFEATSPVIPYLRQLQQAQRSQKRVYRVGLNVRVRATGNRHAFINGVLTNSPSMASVGKTLQPLTYTFTFERVE